MLYAEVCKDAGMDEVINGHGKYVAQFARNHGMSIAEAYEQPMVKAHKKAWEYLNEGKKFIEGGVFGYGA